MRTKRKIKNIEKSEDNKGKKRKRKVGKKEDKAKKHK